MGGAQHTEQCPGFMLPRRPLALALAAAALAAPASGCTSDAPPAQARGGKVAVTLDDFFIAPQKIRAKPGRITFTVTNRGAIGHTFHVKQGDKDIAATKTLLPGASVTVSGTFKKGDYKMVCILGNHEDLGMYGTLAVR
jgi:plastocyanin